MPNPSRQLPCRRDNCRGPGDSRSRLAAALLFLFLLPFSTFPLAKASERWAGLADPTFKAVTGRGLSRDATITAIVEDDEGFLWLGTQSGLARWDGYRFKTYTAQFGVAGSLPGNYVRTLHVDGLGRLWVGTSGAGLARFDRERDVFIPYPIDPNGRTSVNIKAIDDDGSGGLWIATDDGLDHLADPDSGRFVRPGPDSALPDTLANHRVNIVLHDRSGTLWVGGKGGAVRQRKGEAAFTPIRLDPTRLEQPEVSFLFEDGGGRLWIGTSTEGAYVLSPDSDQAIPVAEHDPLNSSLRKDLVQSIAEPRPGEIWLGTFEGIVVIDTATGESRRIRHDPSQASSLPDDIVRGFYTDRSGLLWVGTMTGLSRCNSVQRAVLSLFGARTRAKLHDNHVQVVLTTEDGSAWLGLNPGLQIIDATATRSLDPAASPGNIASALADANVFALAPGPNGHVYVGTMRGLYEVDAGGKVVRAVRLTEGEKQPRIFALLGEKDRLWIGDNDGVLRQLDFTTGKIEKILSPDDAQRLTDPRIRVIRRGPDERLWIGTGHGLNLFDPAKHTVEQVLDDPADPGALADGAVLSVLTDRRGRVWLGTFGGGIHRLEGRDEAGRLRFRRLGVKEGLPNENIDMLLEAPDGRIWASTDDGLAVIDPETLAVHALHDADDVIISNYWVTAGSVTRAGELLFGGAGGLTIVRPDRLTDWAYRPPVVVIEARIDGKAVAVGPGATVPLTVLPEAKSLAVEFSALDYSAPERNRYSYRLEGFDQSWIETDADHRVAAYTNLPPRDYVLHIRGSNRDGVWSESQLALPIRVLPAWYQALWFKLVVGLTALLAIATLMNVRTASLLRRQREIEQLRDSHRLLELGQLAGGVAHDFNNLLGAILGFTQFIIEDTGANDPVHGYAKRIQMAGRRGKGVIQQILTFAQRKESSRTQFGLADLARETAELLRPSIPSTTRLVLDIVDERVTIEADYDQLGQALLNLCLNAHDALAGENGTVTISVASGRDFPDLSGRNPSPSAGAVETWQDDSGLLWAAVGKMYSDRDYAYLLVSDSGSGMEATVLSRVFQPFFTTKSKSRGTGLGLSVVHSVVLANDGWLVVNSRVGSGTCFRIAIPSAGRMFDDSTKLTVSAIGTMSGRILLVDDDPDFGVMLDTALRRCGLSVDYVSNPIDALATLRAHRDAYDVVITDQTMPDMSGLDFVRAAREINATLPCLICTGYSESLTEARAREAGAAALIQKPVDIETIVALLSKLIGAG